MESDDETKTLLARLVALQEEGRDLQKQALNLQSQAVENQAKAIAAQRSLGRLYRIVVFVGALIILSVIVVVARYF